MTKSQKASQPRSALRRLTLAAAVLFGAAFIGPSVADDCDDSCQAAKGIKGLERIYGPGGVLDDCFNNNCNGVGDLPGIDKSDPIDNPEPEPQAEPEPAPEPEPFVDCRPGHPC